MLKTTEPNQQTIPTLVVSRPGMMRQALQAALAAYPWVAVMASAGDGLTALNYTAEHQPGLLVIDSNLLEEEVEALLAAVKVRSPNTRCLVFIRSSQERAQLLASGADAVVLRDGSAQQLQATLLQLSRNTPS